MCISKCTIAAPAGATISKRVRNLGQLSSECHSAMWELARVCTISDRILWPITPPTTTRERIQGIQDFDLGCNASRWGSRTSSNVKMKAPELNWTLWNWLSWNKDINNVSICFYGHGLGDDWCPIGEGAKWPSGRGVGGARGYPLPQLGLFHQKMKFLWFSHCHYRYSYLSYWSLCYLQIQCRLLACLLAC